MDPQQTTDNEPRSIEDGALSTLLTLGVLLMLGGTGILAWFMISSPEIIAFKDVSMVELEAFSGFGINTEFVLASWGLFIAPIMILTGAIFVAGGCIAMAVYKR